VFLHGFAKSRRHSLEDDDLARLKKIASIYLRASLRELDGWRDNGELKEVK
jgi:hypothetical protein